MDGTTATIGMTQDGALRTGTVCSVTLPRVGDRIEANQIIGEIESSRTTKQIIAISGRVINVNTGIEADPKQDAVCCVVVSVRCRTQQHPPERRCS
ncbi:glycine cleavage system H protein, putative [Bodo saltans]|uniref:Glycine cleavage system H protein, putative n=1 Tax=Bodo saltans TaxID=75058 RepID=A0A0S4IKQ2_BODSA|nr:glycine cleavage system H protein, putative [Bodo saltans]|eukprot:CUE67718.1 glycine cleavage system H protein, putative [Bodo saltans]